LTCPAVQHDKNNLKFAVDQYYSILVKSF